MDIRLPEPLIPSPVTSDAAFFLVNNEALLVWPYHIWPLSNCPSAMMCSPGKSCCNVPWKETLLLHRAPTLQPVIRKSSDDGLAADLGVSLPVSRRFWSTLKSVSQVKGPQMSVFCIGCLLGSATPLNVHNITCLIIFIFPDEWNLKMYSNNNNFFLKDPWNFQKNNFSLVKR